MQEVSEELSSVETQFHNPHKRHSGMVSEELSSVETLFHYSLIFNDRRKFQKNLVVWKQSRTNICG